MYRQTLQLEMITLEGTEPVPNFTKILRITITTADGKKASRTVNGHSRDEDFANPVVFFHRGMIEENLYPAFAGAPVMHPALDKPANVPPPPPPKNEGLSAAEVGA